MPVTLQIHIQTDRLPDLPVSANADRQVQIGIRLSAGFKPGQPGDPPPPPLPSNALQMLKPWTWFSSTQPGGSWTVFREVPGAPGLDPAVRPAPPSWIQVPDAACAVLTPTQAPGLVSSISDYLRDKPAPPGLDLVWPNRDAIEIDTSRGFNVPVFIETLSTFAAPLPEALRVWTGLTITLPADELMDTTRFIAIPELDFDGIACGTVDPTRLQVDPTVGVVFPFDRDGGASGTIDEVNYWVHSSLSLADARGDKATEQLLDLSTLTVRATNATSERTDWIHDLAPRISELLHPGLRAIAVLDTMLGRVLAVDPALGDLREALADDLGPATAKRPAGRDLLRRTLAYLFHPILRPRGILTESSLSPSLALARLLATQSSTFAAGCDWLSDTWKGPDPESPSFSGFRAVDRNRFASLLGASELQVEDTDTRLLSDDEAVIDWLVEHWFTEATAAVKRPNPGTQPAVSTWYGQLKAGFVSSARLLGPRLRTALALAKGADQLSTIMAGPQQTPGTPAQPFEAALPGLVTSAAGPAFSAAFAEAFRRACDDAASDLSPADREALPIRRLLTVWQEAAVADVTAQSLLLVPARPPTDEGKPGAGDAPPAPADGTSIGIRLEAERLVTQDAPPCLFQFDQLQAFVDGEDLWRRLAGLGVLVGRDEASGTRAWWSLNVATQHNAATLSDKSEAALAKSAVMAAASGMPPPGAWRKQARVDPVPLAVSEVNGVRDAAIRYDSQSIVAEMQNAPRPVDPNPSAPQSVSPTPYRFIFPSSSGPGSSDWFPKLPPLTFGRTLHFVPYLIGHGGALPLFLRADPADPTKRRDYAIAGGASRGEIRLDAQLPGTRTIPYLRTRPVSAPELGKETQLPGIPPGVASLAAELPALRPPVTLAGGDRSRWFLDGSGRGTMEPPSDPPNACLEIDLGNVTLPQDLTLVVRLHTTVVGQPLLERQIAEVKLAGKLDSGVVLYLTQAGTVIGQRTAGPYAEDRPREVVSVVPLNQAEFEAWQDTHLEISIEQSATQQQHNLFADFDPPAIRWGTGTGTNFKPNRDQPVLPSEAHLGSPPVHVLNGFQKEAAMWARNASITVNFPSVDVTTFDRWINGALSGYGAPTSKASADAVRTWASGAIERAHATLNQSEGKNAQLISDPAVERLIMEVVEIFPGGPGGFAGAIYSLGASKPTPPTMGGSAAIDSWTSSPPFAVTVKSATRDAKGDASVSWDHDPVHDPDHGALSLVDGRSYEVRIYPVIAAEQPDIAPGPARTRFAVCATTAWRRWAGDDDGPRWLGAPRTLRFEVANETVPEIDTAAVEDGKALLTFEFARPPAYARDRAYLRLNPRFDNAGAGGIAKLYPGMRYMAEAMLLNQRWSWRGWPQPASDPNAGGADLGALRLSSISGTSLPDDISLDLRDYAIASFLGRRDDDVGEVQTVKLSRDHVYAGRSQIGDTHAPATGPVLFDKDLDYRGGANLRRFALRLTSRYAPMLADPRHLTINSHYRVTISDVHWQSVIVPDLGQSHAPARPALALILPVTDAIGPSDTVSPVLALFNEAFYKDFNIADEVEVAVETIRRPAPPAAEEQPGANVQQHWPQAGFDPIGTGKPWEGKIVPLRVDGPIGYTFDGTVEAPRFDHSGLLVSLGFAADSWFFAKLNFRRLGLPEFLREPNGKPLRDKFPLQDLVTQSARFLLVNDGRAAPDPQVKRFDLDHEGLVCDFSLAAGQSQTISTGFLRRDTPAASLPGMLTTSVMISLAASPQDPSRFVLELSSDARTAPPIRGKANGPVLSVEVPAGSVVSVRAILSQRPKPNGDLPYTPIGDLSLRFFVDSTDEESAKTIEKRWISLLRLPINVADAFARAPAQVAPPVPAGARPTAAPPPDKTIDSSDPVIIGLHWATTGLSTPRVAPIRLSDYTTGTWCQFPPLMDRIAIARKATDTSWSVLVEDGMTASCRLGKQPVVTLDFPGLGDADTLVFGTPLAALQGAALTIVERTLCILTRFIRDVFGKVRESPVAILLLPNEVKMQANLVDVNGTILWSSADPVASGPGRIRFVQVQTRFGLEKSITEALTKMFRARPDDEIELDTDAYWTPKDAPGRIVGISKPIALMIGEA